MQESQRAQDTTQQAQESSQAEQTLTENSAAQQPAPDSATQDGAPKAEDTPQPKAQEEKAPEPEPVPPVPFAHLHLHTEYSLLDGAARVTRNKTYPLLEACNRLNFPACAITDHGNMFGVYTFYKAAKKHGIKPIIGCEFYVSNDMYARDDTTRDHLVLIAKTTEGYRNLVKMDSLAFVDGFYYKPRIDMALLKQHTRGVICLSACLSGRIPKLLLAGDYEGAKAYAIELRDMFEPGDFYLELQDHGIDGQQLVNNQLYRMAQEIGVKVVATNDVHYINAEDAEMHDVLLCIQTGRKIDDPGRMRFDSDEFYLKSYEQMAELFSWCPEAVTNTMEIVDKCNVEIKKEDLIPPYFPEDGSTAPDYLRRLTFEGLKERYGDFDDSIRQRAEYELNIIISMGFAEYFLIVWDFIHFARKQGIPVGAGRGSGVGSIVAYAIHITNVDPLRYQLLFERFLNPERVSMPDFDVDFCMDRRGEVIQYVTEKYGRDKVCQILALGTMKAKGAIKDVARVYNVPLDIVNKTTKPIPNTPGVTLDKVLGRTGKEDDLKDVCPEVVEMYQTNPDMHRVIDMALRIEGMPRNCSKHAAGVVICKEIISDFVPLQRNGEDITTQFQKEEVEELGMLKMDFLGLTTLTDISKAKQYVYENTGKKIDFAELGYDDPEVYKLIATGETDAVFQLESAGMKRFMKDLRPDCMEDIIAGISLYRPGPIDSIPAYINAKHNPETIRFDHPLLEPILRPTYGFFVYQEQVMQAVQSLAGFTLGRADILRRAMGKKKIDVMKKEKEVFVHGSPYKPARYYKDGTLEAPEEPAVDGAIARGVPEDVAIKVFDDMEGFAKYAFNKSHAAAYAVLAYETAYLKHYHLVELVAAVINDRITKADEVAKYLNFLREKGKQVLRPDINYSDVIFRATPDGAIRFGLNGIKNVGEQAMQILVDERKRGGPYKSIKDMLQRLPVGTVNRKMFENLIKAGAFDSFGHTRAALMAVYESMIAVSNYDKRRQADGQLDFFGEIEPEADDIIPVREFPRLQLLSMEKDALNIYLSGHPLDEYREQLSSMDFNLSYIQDLLHEDDEEEDEQDATSADRQALIHEYADKQVALAGMLSGVKRSTTKSGKLMAYANLEDLYGNIEIVCFPATVAKYKELLTEDALVWVRGRINLNNDKCSLVVQDIRPLTMQAADRQDKPAAGEQKPATQTLYVKVSDRAQYRRICDLFELHPGDVPVRIQFERTLYACESKVRLKESLMMQLRDILGEKNILVK